MKVNQAIKFLDKQITNSSLGLPEEVFLFISRLTPLINVDLLIKDEKGRILLSWRDDQYAGTGWHLPGGIVRFKEKLEHRILQVAKNEIGVAVKYDPEPLAVKQGICDHETRGHFISLLYKCFLTSKFVPKNKGLIKGDRGYLKWHDSCPRNLVKIQQKIYQDYL